MTQDSHNRRWFTVFIAIAFLVLAQVAWWGAVFLQDVSKTAELKHELAVAQGQNGDPHIEKEAFHRRVMFLSESITFGLLTCLALLLLYRALKAEQHSRVIQRNFVETVTHESKTPLTALKLRLESIGEAVGMDSPSGKEVKQALEQVRRLTSIVEKALSLNRLERHAFHFEETELGELVRAVVHRLDPLLNERGVNLQLELEPYAVVRGDAYALQNSIQSLVENAILYNPASLKRVVIRVRRAGSKIVLAVEDNGPGIAVNERSQIFDRFYRGTAGRMAAGTGLGLYLTKTIVEAHQGILRLLDSSVDVNSGSRFEIQLPAARGLA